jgi:glutamyl-Q tRNA(Asp) synthetase
MSFGVVERFAPSPTGLLHLGHAFSALTAFDAATAVDGRFLLRIEDIDRPRSKQHFEDAIFEDLAWLGVRWETPVLRQSKRLHRYSEAVEELRSMGLTYACTCTRGDIKAALSAPQEGVFGPDGLVYPGTCRKLGQSSENAAIRLNMRAATEHLRGGISFTDLIHGPQHWSADDLIEGVGDIVLARRDIGTSYHVAVVVDDAKQGVTHVTRGDDLLEATAIHSVLQVLLGLPCPIYRHHRLIRDEAGKRLAKRDDARAIRAFRDDGILPGRIRELINLPSDQA